MEFLMIPPLVTLGAILIYWFFFIKEKPETIAVLLEPPKGLSVFECGILVDDAINTQDLALELYNLYLKGLIIKKGEDTYSINPDFNEKDLDDLTEGQALLVKVVFDKSGKFFSGKKAHKFDEISDIEMDFLHKEYLKHLSKKINYLKLALYEALTEKGYFKISPFKQRKPFIAIGSVLFAAPLLWNLFNVIDGDLNSLISWHLVIGLGMSGLLLAYSSLFFVRKTKKGHKVKAEFLGFKQYIVTAEKDRIRFILENNIDSYRAILPYAAMFDSLEKWIEPLGDFKKTLSVDELKELKIEISALDIDVSITEKSRWVRAIYDLFWYGIKIITRKTDGWRE
jgi:hypothetical protein